MEKELSDMRNLVEGVKVFPRVTKCKMLDLKTHVVVAEGCWLSSDLNALVHHIPLSSNTIRVCMDLAMPYMSTIEKSDGSTIAWLANRVVMFLAN
ncbi:hypothetical protein WN943_001767 [Citrus x changshan-huyou]